MTMVTVFFYPLGRHHLLVLRPPSFTAQRTPRSLPRRDTRQHSTHRENDGVVNVGGIPVLPPPSRIHRQRVPSLDTSLAGGAPSSTKASFFTTRARRDDNNRLLLSSRRRQRQQQRRRQSQAVSTPHRRRRRLRRLRHGVRRVVSIRPIQRCGDGGPRAVPDSSRAWPLVHSLVCLFTPIPPLPRSSPPQQL